MRNFDLEKIRFFSIIGGMCLVLILVVWKAYDFLPKETFETNNNFVQKPEKNTTIVKAKTNKEENFIENNVENEDEEENIIEDNVEEIKYQVSFEDKKKNLKPLETIYDDSINPNIKTPEQVSTTDYSSSDMFAKAQEYIEDQAYDMAISEYNDILNITDNISTKAKCYDGIAKTYELQRKFGSAIFNAQKANSTEASDTRKNYLNYLYEKTGYKK